MKNIFLILSVFALIFYACGNIIGNKIFASIGIYSLAPLLLLHYLINRTERVNFIYVAAILSAYLGDLYFYNVDVSISVLSMGGFIIFNLLMILVVFEKMSVIKFSKILLASLALTAIFMLITYFIFDEFDKTILIILIYFITLSFLICLCVLHYRKTKTKASLFFLLGVSSYVISSISTEFIYLKKINAFIIIVNATTYYLTNYFYTRAMTKTKSENIDS